MLPPAAGWRIKIGVRNIFFAAIVLFTLGSSYFAPFPARQSAVLARVYQGVGGAMIVPVGRLTVAEIVPRAQYAAAMTFVACRVRIGPLLGPRWAGCWWAMASRRWIFLIIGGELSALWQPLC